VDIPHRLVGDRMWRRAWETIGTADGTHPIANVDAVIADFAAVHHCMQTTAPSSPEPDVCAAYNGCDVPVIECRYPGMGHQAPTSGGADA
jgi:hypothetical protein